MNVFLQRQAAQQADKQISRTFVLVDTDAPAPREIIGFFTLRPYELFRSQLPSDAQSGYTNRIGAFLLAKLGTAKSHQRRGIATELLKEVFTRVVALIDQAGGVGLFVDAKYPHLVRFYQARGLTQLAPNSLSLYMPYKTMAQLVAAIGPAQF